MVDIGIKPNPPTNTMQGNNQRFHKNPLNPLRKLKRDDKSLSWVIMEKYSGVKKQTLLQISNKSKAELKTMNLETYYRIKKYLGIDLIEYIYEE